MVLSPFRAPRPSPSARREADEDDPYATISTPPAAHYATPTTEAAAEANYPPLADLEGPVGLRQRFKLMMQDAELLPEHVKSFKHETILTGLRKRNRDFGIAKEVDSAGGTLAPVIIHRPAFEHCVFLVKPPPSLPSNGGSWVISDTIRGTREPGGGATHRKTLTSAVAASRGVALGSRRLDGRRGHRGGRGGGQQGLQQDEPTTTRSR